MNGFRTRFLVIWTAAVLALWAGAAGADVLTLRDGSILRCEVLSDWTDPETGAEYLQIRVNSSVVRIGRDYVTNVERKPLPPDMPRMEDAEELLERLLSGGQAVAGGGEVSPEPADPELDDDVALKAAEVRGWAYLYDGPAAIQAGDRRALLEGDPFPEGQTLIVSPNSRLTLAFGNAGRIGLYGRTRIRLDKALMDRSTYGYRIETRLEEGEAWFDLDTALAGGRNIILEVNSVRAVFKRARLYAEAGERSGAVAITMLDGPSKLSFYRGVGDRFTASAGDVLRFSPNSYTPDAGPNPEADELTSAIENWGDWEPRPLIAELDFVAPPLRTYPRKGIEAALYPYGIAIDETMMLPPETRSQGEILAAYKSGLEAFKRDVGRYPTAEEGLAALFESPGLALWKGPYLEAGHPRFDLWGTPFIYQLYETEDGVIPDVRSAGPNRKDDHGLEDDLR